MGPPFLVISPETFFFLSNCVFIIYSGTWMDAAIRRLHFKNVPRFYKAEVFSFFFPLDLPFEIKQRLSLGWSQDTGATVWGLCVALYLQVWRHAHLHTGEPLKHLIICCMPPLTLMAQSQHCTHSSHAETWSKAKPGALLWWVGSQSKLVWKKKGRWEELWEKREGAWVSDRAGKTEGGGLKRDTARKEGGSEVREAERWQGIVERGDPPQLGNKGWGGRSARVA